MKRIPYFLITTLLFACISMMGANVKVLKLQPQGVDFDLQGMYVTVKVQLQLSNVGDEECGCLVLMNNGKWNDQNLTFESLIDKVETMCAGDTLLNATKGPVTATFPMEVPIEREYMTGKDSALYFKAYIVDVKQQRIIAQGQMVRYVPDQQAMKQQMIKSAANIAGGMLGAIFGAGSGSSSKKDDVCPDCKGDGKCATCRGTKIDTGQLCTRCSVEGNCLKCGGTGHVGKNFMQMLVTPDDSEKQQKNTKKEQNSTGNPLLDLFGF
jgi:hypothetical protein